MQVAGWAFVVRRGRAQLRRTHIVQLGELLDDGRELVVEVLLCKLDLARVKRADTRDFVTPEGWAGRRVGGQADSS